MGRKKRPFYRIVAADSRSPRDGRFIEQIGHYNPITEKADVQVNEERALYWLGVGAIPTRTVKNILSRQGILLKYHLRKQGLSEERIQEEYKKWEVLQLEKARRLEAQKTAESEKEKEEAETKAEEPLAEQTREPEAKETAEPDVKETRESEVLKTEQTPETKTAQEAEKSEDDKTETEEQKEKSGSVQEKEEAPPTEGKNTEAEADKKED